MARQRFGTGTAASWCAELALLKVSIYTGGGQGKTNNTYAQELLVLTKNMAHIPGETHCYVALCGRGRTRTNGILPVV